MKLIVAGSRTFTNYHFLKTKLRKLNPSEIVSGTARGADQLGEQFAKEHQLPIKRFPADWENQGRTAGFMRNIKMALYADALAAFWDGHSRGTKHMIETAREQGLKVYIFKET